MTLEDLIHLAHDEGATDGFIVRSFDAFGIRAIAGGDTPPIFRGFELRESPFMPENKVGLTKGGQVVSIITLGESQ